MYRLVLDCTHTGLCSIDGPRDQVALLSLLGVFAGLCLRRAFVFSVTMSMYVTWAVSMAFCGRRSLKSDGRENVHGSRAGEPSSHRPRGSSEKNLDSTRHPAIRTEIHGELQGAAIEVQHGRHLPNTKITSETCPERVSAGARGGNITYMAAVRGEQGTRRSLLFSDRASVRLGTTAALCTAVCRLTSR